MATNNNAVTVTAGLTCSAVTTPAIGASVVQASIAYVDGETAADKIVSVSTATALNDDLTDTGFIFIFNPATNTASVTIASTATVIGPIPPGFGVVLPLASGTVIKGTSDPTQSVGVTVVRTTANV
jgi:hypothetical protein